MPETNGTEQIAGLRVRLKPSAIEDAVASGRMTRYRADELLADGGEGCPLAVGVHFFRVTMPPEDRTAPVTVAQIATADGRNRAIMIRRDAYGGWLLFSDDDGPFALTPGGVDGWQNAVASARARACYVASSWLV